MDYSWVPLESETNGFNNQTVFNVISMAKALAFGFFSQKNPLHLVIELIKISSINFWVKLSFFCLPVPG